MITRGRATIFPCRLVHPLERLREKKFKLINIGILSQMAVMANLADETDGIIISSSYAIEGLVLEACEEFKKLYPVGIQIAPFGWEKGAVIQDENIRGYLDKQKKNSVLYISFGHDNCSFIASYETHEFILISSILIMLSDHTSSLSTPQNI
jgi:hypothetical protein